MKTRTTVFLLLFIALVVAQASATTLPPFTSSLDNLAPTTVSALPPGTFVVGTGTMNFLFGTTTNPTKNKGTVSESVYRDSLGFLFFVFQIKVTGGTNGDIDRLSIGDWDNAISIDAPQYAPGIDKPATNVDRVVSVFDNFTSGAGWLTLNVWSDDTADVKLDGANIFPAIFTQSICSGHPIGCLPQDAGVIHHAIGAGPHTLEFVMYQVGTGGNTTSNPFGLQFTGTAPAPEPSSLLLLGSGLMGCVYAWCLRRR